MNPFHPAAASALDVLVFAVALPASPARAQAQTPAAATCPALLNHSFPRLQDEKPQALCQYAGKVPGWNFHIPDRP